MAITDKNFKFSTASKARVALSHGDAAHKAHLKRMLIDAQVSEESARRAALKSKDTGNRRTPTDEPSLT